MATAYLCSYLSGNYDLNSRRAYCSSSPLRPSALKPAQGGEGGQGGDYGPAKPKPATIAGAKAGKPGSGPALAGMPAGVASASGGAGAALARRFGG